MIHDLRSEADRYKGPVVEENYTIYSEERVPVLEMANQERVCQTSSVKAAKDDMPCPRRSSSLWVMDQKQWHFLL